MRNNEVYGDMTAWIAAHAGDNESDLMRLKRNLRLAREEELTARQRELLRLRYEENMTVTEIAAAIGRDKSTVSHALPRAEKALQVPPLWAIIKRQQANKTRTGT